VHTQFWLENLKRRDSLQDLGVDGRIIIKMDLMETGCGGVDWIQSAQDKGDP
jgi:hypothetical protein